jgi:mRNA interferase RelE/StbE
MIYKLTFLESSKKEWDKLPDSIKKILKLKLIERLENPVHQKDRLHGLPDCYKIKLNSSGYRLVYKVFSDKIVVQVIEVGKRDKLFVYKKAKSRLD